MLGSCIASQHHLFTCAWCVFLACPLLFGSCTCRAAVLPAADARCVGLCLAAQSL